MYWKNSTHKIMHYQIENTGLKPSEEDIKLIETRLALYLSRYNNLINDLTILFSRVEEKHRDECLIHCRINLKLRQVGNIEMKDASRSISDAFMVTATRLKRSIERQLKRNSATRIGSYFDNRPQ